VNVPLWLWLATIGGLLAVILADLFLVDHEPHAVTVREATRWVLFYVALAVAFGIGMWALAGGVAAGEFFAGYITEYSLSVDNLFVFVIIMAAFKVPVMHQHRVLLVGIVIALVMRGGFIAVGAAAIQAFSWVFYLFAAVLVVTAVNLFRQGTDHDEEFSENAALRLVRRVLPVTPQYHGARSFVRHEGRRMVTPMLIVMFAIGSTDLLFALDSIPAIFGLTQEPYLVFTANAFALMGLRQLYFLLGGLLSRLVYLSYGLSVILAFIGVKLVLEALHDNSLPFVNGGEPVAVPTIGILPSLTVIVGVLAVTTVASLLKSRRTPVPVPVAVSVIPAVAPAAVPAAAQSAPEPVADRAVARSGRCAPVAGHRPDPTRV
jgi:TerC family integral membrane protein